MLVRPLLRAASAALRRAADTVSALERSAGPDGHAATSTP
jgi:hypothetical protein